MDNNMVSKCWVGMSTTDIHLLQFKITCKNADFECRYIRTQTKEKTFKISNSTFAILPFSHKNTLTNFTILTQTTQNLQLVNLKCVTQKHPGTEVWFW